MAHSSSVVKVFLLSFFVHLSSAVSHTLQVFYTGVTPGINFSEFTALSQLDGVRHEYYDSEIRKKIPKTEWIKKIDVDIPDYWSRYTQKLQGNQEIFKRNIDTLMQRFNQNTGVHTVQMMCGCELDDDGTTRGYYQHGYDGEDLISFDLKSLTWIAPTPQALITKNKWDNTGNNNYWKSYLEKDCIDWLRKYVDYGKETLERKVRPTASVFQKHSPPEVVCHATGFFPKTVMITWQKDGEDVHEDVDLRDTLPNQDGSFQKRSILKVSAEDLQKHNYTCVIQHSSLGEKMVLEVPKGGAPIGIIVGAVVVLLVLVAVVAGIVVWKKKKNSGFKPVPPKPAPEGDSQSSMISLQSDSSSNNCWTVCVFCTERERGEEDEDRPHTHTPTPP